MKFDRGANFDPHVRQTDHVGYEMTVFMVQRLGFVQNASLNSVANWRMADRLQLNLATTTYQQDHGVPDMVGTHGLVLNFCDSQRRCSSDPQIKDCLMSRFDTVENRRSQSDVFATN